MTGDKIYLQQRNIFDADGKHVNYIVAKTINTVTPKIGDTLTEAQVQELIDGNAQVTITPLTA